MTTVINVSLLTAKIPIGLVTMILAVVIGKASNYVVNHQHHVFAVSGSRLSFKPGRWQTRSMRRRSREVQKQESIRVRICVCIDNRLSAIGEIQINPIIIKPFGYQTAALLRVVYSRPTSVRRSLSFGLRQPP